MRHLIWDKLRELKSEGMTILLTTHYMDEAYQLCDIVLIMDKGRKVMEGPPQDLLNRNIERYVLEIVGADAPKTLAGIEIPDGVRVEHADEQPCSMPTKPMC